MTHTPHASESLTSDLIEVADGIADLTECVKLAVELGLPSKEVTVINSNKFVQSDTARGILFKWRMAKGKEATAHDLHAALKSIGRVDLADDLGGDYLHPGKRAKEGKREEGDGRGGETDRKGEEEKEGREIYISSFELHMQT